MARTRGSLFAIVAVGYTLIGLYYLSRRYYAFGLMWLFFGAGGIAEFVRLRNESPPRWLNPAKWVSLTLGLVMIGVWVLSRH